MHAGMMICMPTCLAREEADILSCTVISLCLHNMHYHAYRKIATFPAACWRASNSIWCLVARRPLLGARLSDRT